MNLVRTRVLSSPHALHNASINSQGGARCCRCEWTGDVRHQRCDLFGRSESFNQRGWPNFLKELPLKLAKRLSSRLRKRIHEVANSARSGWTRKNAVHRNTGTGKCFSQATRDGELCGFGHSVVNHLRRNLYRALTGNQDNAAQLSRFIAGKQRRARRTPLKTLTSKNLNQSASGISSNGFGSKMPRLLTRISLLKIREVMNTRGVRPRDADYAAG